MIVGFENLCNKVALLRPPGLYQYIPVRVIAIKEIDKDVLFVSKGFFYGRVRVSANDTLVLFAIEEGPGHYVSADNKIEFYIDENDRLHRPDGPAYIVRGNPRESESRFYLHGTRYITFEELFEAAKGEDATDAIFGLGDD